MGKLIEDAVQERRAIVHDYHATHFAFFCPAKKARDLGYYVVFMRKDYLEGSEYLLKNAFLRSEIFATDSMKSKASIGKPCLRIKRSFLQAELTFAHEGFDPEANVCYLKVNAGKPFTKVLAQWREEARRNAGFGFERWLCGTMGWKHIGELDNQNHKIHTDGENYGPDGQKYEVEIKLHTGWLTKQMYSKGDKWAAGNETTKANNL